MLLSYAGTLRDLNAQKIVLRDGLEVTVYSDSDEEEDIEIDGIVCFGKLGDTDYSGEWYVRTNPNSMRFVKAVERGENFFIPCFKCGADIHECLNRIQCPFCGFEIEHARHS
jgi:hypothetical protein